MAVVAKHAAARIPGAEIAFLRFVVGLGGCAIASRFARIRPQNLRGLALRGVLGGTAVLLYFQAIAHLPVGIATLLNYTAPVFTTIYAAVFLREAVPAATLAALTITSAGVVLVVQGGAVPGARWLGLWQLVGLGSAVFSGAAVATIRQVRKTDGPWAIFSAFCGAGALITAGPAIAAWVPPRAAEWLSLLAVGLLSLVAQLAMTYALGFVRAAVSGVIAQLTPAAALFIGWAALGERVSGRSGFGAALTIAGVSLGAYLAAREPRVQL
jgi:drug/metabolite transporter (DMT)-like permease